MNDIVSVNLYASIKEVVDNAGNTVQRAVNNTLDETYRHIGKLIARRDQ